MLQAALKLNTPEVIEKVMMDSAEDYKNLQRNQMLHGLNSKGQKIGKYRNPIYARMKAQLNPLAGEGNVDLKLTGDFQSDMFLDVRGDTFIVDSADEKSQQLQTRYGEEIFGLDTDYKQQFADLARPKTVTAFIDELNKNA